MHEGDLSRGTLELVFHDFAGEKLADDSQVLSYLAKLQRAEPHQAAGGVPRSDPEVDPAGRELVERGEPVSHRGRDPGRGYGHAHSQADAGRLHRGRRHRDEDFGYVEGAVVKPGVGEPELLGTLYCLPAFSSDNARNSVVHAFPWMTVLRRHGSL